MRVVVIPRVGRLALSVAVAFVASGAMASAAFAWSFSANVTPASVPAGTTNTFSITLTNTSGSNGLGSAVIKPPTAFTLSSASLGAQPGNVSLTPKKLTLTGLNLQPGMSDTISVGVIAPCVDAGFIWDLTAYSKGLGSQQLDLGDPDYPTTDLTSACGLEFVTEPNNALIKTRITGSSYDASGPPVTVQVLDANGNPTNSSPDVTIGLGTDTAADSGGATLGGNTTNPSTGGVATFKGLKLDLPDNNYTLVASAWGLNSGESSPFDIADGETDCNTSMDCLLTLTGADSTLAIDASPNNGQLTGQVDPGTPMDGPGSNPDADPGCAGYDPVNVDWYGFDVVNQDDEDGPPAKTITWTVRNVTPDGFMVCFGSTSPFVVVNSDDEIDRAQPGTLPDGTQPVDGEGAFVGFLPFCDQLGDGADREPCITDDPLQTRPDRYSTTGEDVIVDVRLPAYFPGDPYMGR